MHSNHELHYNDLLYVLAFLNGFLNFHSEKLGHRKNCKSIVLFTSMYMNNVRLVRL